MSTWLLIIFLFLLVKGFKIAPFLPANKKDLPIINKVADLKPGQTFVELGAGDARVSTFIAKKNPNCKVIAIELSLPIFIFAKLKSIFGPTNLTIKYGDCLEYNLSNADVVYTYALIKTINNKIKPKVIQELNPNAKLISYVFSIKKWPYQKFSVSNSKGYKLIHTYFMQ